jgi:hypothetical protein
MARTQLTAALLHEFESKIKNQSEQFHYIKRDMDSALNNFLWDDPVARRFKADYEEKLKPLQTKLLPALDTYQRFLYQSAEKAETYASN